MPLNTSSKRRSSVALWAPWQTAPPSPTDTPGVIDADDSEHAAWSYSGLVAVAPEPPEESQMIWRPIWRPRKR